MDLPNRGDLIPVPIAERGVHEATAGVLEAANDGAEKMVYQCLNAGPDAASASETRDNTASISEAQVKAAPISKAASISEAQVKAAPISKAGANAGLVGNGDMCIGLWPPGAALAISGANAGLVGNGQRQSLVVDGAEEIALKMLFVDEVARSGHVVDEALTTPRVGDPLLGVDSEKPPLMKGAQF